VYSRDMGRGNSREGEGAETDVQERIALAGAVGEVRPLTPISTG
jgi:hypothetical protein